jgi:hypothetical protein
MESKRSQELDYLKMDLIVTKPSSTWVLAHLSDADINSNASLNPYLPISSSFRVEDKKSAFRHLCGMLIPARPQDSQRNQYD